MKVVSYAKEQLENQEAQARAAEKVCVRAEALQQCEVCETIWDDGGGDADEAFALGLKLMSREDGLVDVFDGDETTLRAAIDDAIAQAPDECECSRKMNKDD